MPSPDETELAQLDIDYQSAVERNDAPTMDRILLDGMVLVTGSGRTYSKKELLEEARSGRVVYERQDADQRSVRQWGDTAVVTAFLTAKGTDAGTPFSYCVWYTDTYIRTPTGWRYAHGQSGARQPGPV
ncbi:MAG: nuclear transport factor 2 family protein [Thermoplasmata archaeon]|jgi:ketosteroid isomerase-like protein